MRQEEKYIVRQHGKDYTPNKHRCKCKRCPIFFGMTTVVVKKYALL